MRLISACLASSARRPSYGERVQFSSPVIEHKEPRTFWSRAAEVVNSSAFSRAMFLKADCSTEGANGGEVFTGAFE